MVKQEKLAFLANNPFYTKRFSFYIGRRYRSSTIKDVAKEFRLDWSTVKALEMQYMKEQLRRYPPRKPRIIGIDEISLRKGHVYRIVVSDLVRRRPIWFGGEDRSEESMDKFFKELGLQARGNIRLAVMDRWKAFSKSTRKNAPQASILFDKFHVLRHLGEALDLVRRSEYARLSGTGRRYIKGQKYMLPSIRENLSSSGRVNLRRQRLPSYEKFAAMIERHWDGIAAYCRPENKVALGFVEGFNYKIRVIQRRDYGLRNEEYLRLKILTRMLPAI